MHANSAFRMVRSFMHTGFLQTNQIDSRIIFCCCHPSITNLRDFIFTSKKSVSRGTYVNQIHLKDTWFESIEPLYCVLCKTLPPDGQHTDLSLESLYPFSYKSMSDLYKQSMVLPDHSLTNPYVEAK